MALFSWLPVYEKESIPHHSESYQAKILSTCVLLSVVYCKYF